jgi:hypothetical protein
VLIVNGETKAANMSQTFPSNVRVIRRDNSCFDGGSIGRVLEEYPEILSQKKYKYYFLINSSVRGPFMPRYWPESLHWTKAFTQLLNERVKLVGTTINCQRQVHVQSMVLATDQVGFDILREEKTLACPVSMKDAITTYELGSSSAIFRRG